jgi:hypothetical protein
VPAWFRAALAAAAVLGWGACLSAQPSAESRIRVVVSGAQGVRDDIKYILELAPGNLKKQAKTVDEILEGFQQGVDPRQPMAVDFVFSANELLYQPIFPIEAFEGRNGFLANLNAFGWKVQGPVNGLYTITEPPRQAPRGTKKTATPKTAATPAKPFFMRYVHGHAFLASRQTDLPANVADPSAELKKLVGTADVVAEIKNDAATLPARLAAFKEFRKQIEAALKYKRGEAEADFALRKLSTEQTFNELERFLIETQRLEVSWTTDPAGKTGRGALRLEALPKTSLEHSVEQLVQRPSYFAHVKLHEDKPVLALKVNFAIDELRSQHARDLYAALRPVIKLRYDERPALTAAGKAAAKEASDKLLDLFESARAIQVLDGFIDLHVSGEQHTGVCGIRCVDGDKVVDLLGYLPKIREGWDVQTHVEEHGGVKIHKVHIAPHRHEEFHALFAGEPVVYIGTSADAVWGAAGVGALDELKAAIDQASQPPPDTVDPEFFRLKINFGPLVDVVSIFRAKEPKKPADDKEAQEAAEQLEKQLAKLKKFAKDSFGACEVPLEAALKRDGNAVVGTMTVQECVLRFVGSAAADWAAENLQ